MGNNVRLDFENCIMTLLSYDQVFGDSKINYFYKFTNDCSATDFAILQGCALCSDVPTDNAGKLKSRQCLWDLSTMRFNGRKFQQHIGNKKYSFHEGDRHSTGLRPAYPFNKIEYIGKTKKGKIYVDCEFFEYPQYAVNQELGAILEKRFLENTLRKTGKTYTTDAAEKDDEPFTPVKNDEYYYRGEKYVRTKAKKDGILSTGQEVKKGDYVWVKVSPLKWIIDVKAKLAFCEKVITSGVRFCEPGRIITFSDSEVNMFFNEYLINELYPSKIEKTPEEYIEDVLDDIKQYRDYYLGVIDIEGKISKLINNYNNNLRSLLDNKNPLSLNPKDSNVLYKELVDALNVILEEAKKCEKDIKPCYDMMNILDACYEDSANPGLDAICQDIYTIRTVIIPFITDAKTKSRLKSDLNGIIDKYMNHIRAEVSKYKNNKVSSGKSLNDLKIEFRTKLSTYLTKLNEAVIKQDLVSEIIEATKVMIESHFTMSKNERVKSLLNHINTAVTYIKEYGDASDRELLEKEISKINNVDLSKNLNEIIKDICEVLKELYKLQFKIEERNQKNKRINNLMVHTDIPSFFASEEKNSNK